MKTNNNNEDNYSIPFLEMLAFFTGGALIAAATFLFALEEGRRTREQIRSFAEGTWNRTRQAMNDLAQHGRDLMAETMAPLGAAYAAGREAFWREYNRERFGHCIDYAGSTNPAQESRPAFTEDAGLQ